MTKTKRLTPSIDLLLPSARLIKDNLFVFFVLLVIPLLLSNLTAPMTAPPADATTEDLLRAYQSTITPYVIAGSILTLVFYPLLTYAQWKVTTKKSVDMQTILREAIPHYWRLLGLLIIMGIVISLGFIAFVIPGLIFLRCFVLAPYFMIEQKLGIIESMRVSARKTKPFSWSIYGILGIMFLYAMVSLVGVLGQMITTILLVLYSLALPLRFHEIQRASKA